MLPRWFCERSVDFMPAIKAKKIEKAGVESLESSGPELEYLEGLVT